MSINEPIRALRAVRPEPKSGSLLDPHGAVADRILIEVRARARHESVAPSRRKVRPQRRLALVLTAVILLAMLVGIRLTGAGPESGVDVGAISEATARQIATDALEQASQLIDADTTSITTIKEVGGDHRVRYESRVIGFGRDTRRIHVVDDDRAVERQPPAGVRRSDTRVIGALQYTPALPNDRTRLGVTTDWVADLAMSGPRAQSAALPPDLQSLVRQLEEEGRIDARRVEGGGVVVELTRPADDLMPVDNARVDQDPTTLAGRRRDPDPVQFFAYRAAEAGKATPVSVRVTVDSHGELRTLRMRATYAGAFRFTGAPASVERLEAAHEERWQWSASSPSDIAAPEASNVTVVGFAFAARRGRGGIFGVHGRLDQVGYERAVELVKQIHLEQRRLRGRSERMSPRIADELRAHHERFQQVIERVERLGKRTPQQLSRDASCTPYWPASGRAMPRDRAEADPGSAGWRCTLDDATGGYTLTPGSTKLEPFVAQGGS